MPMVSVIIPAYNCKDYINDALESVFQQDFSDIEIVIVDDGSTDGTGELLSPLVENKGVRYFYQANSGPGAARNRGISEAHGDYICFLDADDALLPSSIHKRVDFLNRYPDAGMVFTDLYRVKSLNGPHEIHLQKNNFLEKFKQAISRENPPEYIFNARYIKSSLKHHPFIKTPTVMIRKSIINQVGGFDESLRAAEDVDLWLRIAKVVPVGFIDEPLAIWNNYRSSLTSDTERFYKDSLAYYKKLHHSSFLSNEEQFFLKKKIAKLLFNNGYYFFQQGRLREARQLYLESLAFRPFQFLPFKGLGVTFLPDFLLKVLRKRNSPEALYNG